MSMMIFGILFFLGLFTMFVFILLGQEKVIKVVLQELTHTRTQLAALEKRLDGAQTLSGYQEYADAVHGTTHMHSSPNISSAAPNELKFNKISTPAQASFPLQEPALEHPYSDSLYAQGSQSLSGKNPINAKSSGGLDLFMPPPKR